MEATLQDIFREGFEAYAASHKLPLKHHKAAHAIMRCRTPEQGGHELRCPDDHEHTIQYHSCRHRSCPKCNALPKAEWAEKQFHRLLPVDHYHAIFTLPHELLPIWRFNQAWCVKTFFRVVNETLMTLMKDEKYLGAVPGVIMNLHTWGRNLILHPHVHCLITGGGITSSGQWKRIKKQFLLPGRVVSALYKGKFLGALWRGLKKGEIHFNSDQANTLEKLLKAAGKKKWNVRIQPPYAHGKGVMKYLARYVKGGPIGNHRIIAANDEQVTFHYKDHRDGKHKIQVLRTGPFISRILEHVAESRQHVVRHFGLYGHQSVDKRESCRGQLGDPPQKSCSKDKRESKSCTICGKVLVKAGVVFKNSLYKVKPRRSVQQGDQPDMRKWHNCGDGVT